MPVEILGDGAYRGFIAPVAVSSREPIHIARIRLPDNTLLRAYVKLYEESADNKGLVNEITGHLLAEALNLTVPTHAGIVLIPREAIPSPPAWVSIQEDDIPAWFSQDMASPDIRFFFDLENASSWAALEPVRRELEKAGNLADILAFDDWVANVDRHVGNLLRLGRGEYVLIDHGMIFGGMRWTADHLKVPDMPFRNRLRDDFLPEKEQSLPFKNRLIQCRGDHAKVLEEKREPLREWWSDLLNDEECDAAWGFLHARATFDDLPRRYGLLL